MIEELDATDEYNDYYFDEDVLVCCDCQEDWLECFCSPGE